VNYFLKICIFCIVLSLFLWINSPAQASLEGENLRVVTKNFVPFAFEQNGQYVGFSIDLWKEIAKELNIDYEIYKEQSINDLLNAVSTGPADVGIAGITITSIREETVDFSYPFFETGLQILISAHSFSPVSPFFSLLFSPIFLQTVGFIISMVLVVAHLIWYFERNDNSAMFPREYALGIPEAIWWAVVTVVTVGYGDKVPNNRMGRIIATVWMFGGILLISYFTASMTSALTVQQLSSDITNVTDLIGKQVATVEGSTAADYLKNRPLGVLEFKTIGETFQALEEKKVNAIVYDSPVLVYYASGEKAGKVKLVGPVFQQQSYGIAFKEKSEYREPINRVLLTLKENGSYNKIYEKWFGEQRE
jgi:ABC-type amino acid transport substrate-binding protein